MADIPENAHDFVVGDDALYFAADDTDFRSGTANDTGPEVWRATLVGNDVEVVVLDSSVSPSRLGTDPQELTVVGSEVFFSGIDPFFSQTPDETRSLYSSVKPSFVGSDTSPVGYQSGQPRHKNPEHLFAFEGTAVMTVDPERQSRFYRDVRHQEQRRFVSHRL